MAVDAVRRGNHDIVLMDVQMPVLDGVQATKQIRALPPPKNTLPIIALTAHAMAGARDEYLASGMNDYLSKPLDPAALFAKLSELAGSPPAAADCDEPGTVAFDPNRLGALAAHMTSAEVVHLATLFLEQIDKDIAQIQALAEDMDLAALGLAISRDTLKPPARHATKGLHDSLAPASSKWRQPRRPPVAPGSTINTRLTPPDGAIPPSRM
jgi:CheY-like chemotaxis protein